MSIHREASPCGGDRHGPIRTILAHEAVKIVGETVKILDRGENVEADYAAMDGIAADAIVSTNGWVSSAFFTDPTGNPIDRFEVKWTVPVVPNEFVGQTIFLFSGLLDSAGAWILQPVLQFASVDGQPPAWWIASWFVGGGGRPAFRSARVQVPSGTNLTGVMKLVGRDASKFDFDCSFAEFPETRLSVLGIDDIPTCAIALESYGVANCNNYPAQNGLAFHGLSIRGATVPATLQWTTEDKNRACSEATTVVDSSSSNGELRIDFR